MPTSMQQNVRPDLEGELYTKVLAHLHETLQPKTYFEIGTLHGDTLALSRCASVAVDPEFRLNNLETIGKVFAKPSLAFFQMGSDDFFAQNDPEVLLGGKIEFAFLDGMHRCEFLLRDFINTEKSCKRNSIIALHDCLPVETSMTGRVPSVMPPMKEHRKGWWAGDVWRTALLLKRTRPDLSIVTLDSFATGLLLITNLDPTSTMLAEGYSSHVKTMMSWSLDELGIAALFDELQVQSTSDFAMHEQVTARFWL